MAVKRFANKPETPSEPTVGRLCLYRGLLAGLERDGVDSIYSHQLAALAGGAPSRVRRDLMAVGYDGSPTRGYVVLDLLESIGRFLDAPQREGVALVGVGNLGRALMAFFAGRRPNLAIVAAFDSDPDKAGRVIHGRRCYGMDSLGEVVRANGIRVAILSVPAGEAQGVADQLIRAGVRGLLNFAPVRLNVPAGVFVENMDMAVSLEKVAYFARQSEAEEGI
jgi:redox-sensing transcriptional repressor